MYKILTNNDKITQNTTKKIQINTITKAHYTNTTKQYKYYRNMYFKDSKIKKSDVETEYTGDITVVSVKRQDYKGKLSFSNMKLKENSTIHINTTTTIKRINTNSFNGLVLQSDSKEQTGILFENDGIIILYGGQQTYQNLTIQTLYGEQFISDTIYFIRCPFYQFNVTSNSTKTTSNREVYITTIGLYDDANNLLAIARTSKPLYKDNKSQINLRFLISK